MEEIKNFLKILRSLNGITASLGTIVPGLSFFLQLDIPYLPGPEYILLAAIGLISLITAFKNTENSNIGNKHKAYIALSILCLLMFIPLKSNTTVHVAERNLTKQVGFGLASWSLTEFTKNKKFSGEYTKEDIMYKMNGFEEGGVYRIWKSWTVYLAGTLLSLSLILSVAFWSYGWGLIATAKSMYDE